MKGQNETYLNERMCAREKEARRDRNRSELAAGSSSCSILTLNLRLALGNNMYDGHGLLCARQMKRQPC